MKLLEVKDITLRFGGLSAISNVSFELIQGEILAIIGPNGAGKTSLFNVITGLYRPTSGSIKFRGKALLDIPSTAKKVLGIFLAIVFAFAFMLAMNAQELWQNVIVNNYVYQEPFYYLAALSSAGQYLLNLDYRWSLIPFAVCFIFASASLIKFQKSAEFSPLVAAKAGFARTFQNLRLLSNASVAENIKTVIKMPSQPSLLASIFGCGLCHKFEKSIEIEVKAVLEQLELSEYSDRRVDCLPYGLQRRVEIARAFATKPKILLLDEPAAGLNPSESRHLLELVKKISASGITVLLIEHDMSVVMELSNRIIVLHHGEKIAEGSPHDVRQDPEVIKAYLGSSIHV